MKIETDRLIIRIPSVEDADAVNSAICESINELSPYMHWAQKLPSVDDSRESIRSALKLIESNEDIRLLIYSRDGDFVGSSGLHKIDWRIPKAEIGYWVRSSRAGNGYITEAVDAISNFAFDIMKMKRVEIIVSGSNNKSINVAKRCGFELEGILRSERVNPNGEIDDTCIYAKIA